MGDPNNGGFREWYIRDAQGNIMAVYKYTNNGSASLKVTDRPIYGSKRLGSYTRQLELVGDQTITTYPYMQPMQARLKRYELTDHLGNVNTVVTGRLLPGNGAGSAYQAEVVKANGYEAFGALLPGRNYPYVGPIPSAPAVDEDFEGAQVNGGEVNGWNASVVAVLTVDGGSTDRLKVSDAVIYDGAQLNFSTIPGGNYTVSLDLDLGTAASVGLALYAENPYGSVPGCPVWTTSGTKSFSFTAATSLTRIKVYKAAQPTSTHYFIDNVTVEMGQNLANKGYRFGFQGQEKDDEIYGATGTSYAFTYRMHDARVGRFWSLDPLAAKYAYNSPYAFSENRVIDGFELEGLEFMKSNGMFTVGKGSRGIRRPFLPGYYKQLQLKTYEDVKYQVGQYFMQANTISSGSPEQANGVVAKSTSSIAANMGAYLLQHSKAAAEEAIKQDDYVNQSLGLVASAVQMGLIPDVFKGDETFQSDVASFLYDSSLPSGSDSKSQAYRSIVGILGKEIFNNRSEITKGSYQRDAPTMSFDRPMGLDRPSLGPVVRGGHTESALDRAITRFVDAPEGNFRKDKISKAE